MKTDTTNLYEVLQQENNLEIFCESLGERGTIFPHIAYLRAGDTQEYLSKIFERLYDGDSDILIVVDDEIVFNRDKYGDDIFDDVAGVEVSVDEANEIIQSGLKTIDVELFDDLYDYTSEWSLDSFRVDNMYATVELHNTHSITEKDIDRLIDDIKDQIVEYGGSMDLDFFSPEIRDALEAVVYDWSDYRNKIVISGQSYDTIVNSGELAISAIADTNNYAYVGYGRVDIEYSVGSNEPGYNGSGYAVVSLKYELDSAAVFTDGADARSYTMENMIDELIRIKKELMVEFGLAGSKYSKVPKHQLLTHNLQIKDPVLYNLAFELTKLGYSSGDFIDVKTLKKISKTNIRVAKSLLKQSGNDFLRNHPNGFSINDIIVTSRNPTTPISNREITIDEDFIRRCVVGKDLLYGFGTWDGAQIYYKDLTNHVFRLDFNKKITDSLIGNADTTEYTISDGVRSALTSHRQNIIAYMKNSNHPTNTSGLLTFGWVRYTIVGDTVVLDEIQSDLDNKDMIPGLMSGWEDIMMKAFIDFVRNRLGYRIIRMPTYKTKINDYNANPPMRLYKELPNRFGFEKIDDGWMVLESSFRKYIQRLLV